MENKQKEIFLVVLDVINECSAQKEQNSKYILGIVVNTKIKSKNKI